MQPSKQLMRFLVLVGTMVLGNALDQATAAAGELAAAEANAAPKQALKQRYDAFVKSLNHRTLADDYAGAVRNLDSSDPNKQSVGIKTLAATDELRAIPWIVPFIDSKHRHVRVYAGQALNALVASHQLKRRDKSQPDKVVILPPGPDDVDLKAMSWVLGNMLEMPDDGNIHAFAANMIGYLGLEEYKPELRQLLDSRHPAVTRAAERALTMIAARETFTHVENGNLTLYVSNQSFAINPVDVTIYIDGKEAVSADFDVTGKRIPQHNWIKHSLTVAPGKHRLKAMSKKGEASLEKEFEIKGKHWAVVDYWYYPKSHYNPTPRHFSFDIQDEPIRFE